MSKKALSTTLRGIQKIKRELTQNYLFTAKPSAACKSEWSDYLPKAFITSSIAIKPSTFRPSARCVTTRKGHWEM